jgi:hypothetical protein
MLALSTTPIFTPAIRTSDPMFSPAMLLNRAYSG